MWRIMLLVLFVVPFSGLCQKVIVQTFMNGEHAFAQKGDRIRYQLRNDPEEYKQKLIGITDSALIFRKDTLALADIASVSVAERRATKVLRTLGMIGFGVSTTAIVWLYDNYYYLDSFGAGALWTGVTVGSAGAGLVFTILSAKTGSEGNYTTTFRVMEKESYKKDYPKESKFK